LPRSNGFFFQLGNRIDALEDLLAAIVDDLLGQILLFEVHQLLDLQLTLFQRFTNGEEPIDHHGGSRQSLQDGLSSFFDALGNLNFAFSAQEGHRTHFFEVHANGVLTFLRALSRAVSLGNLLPFGRLTSGFLGYRFKLMLGSHHGDRGVF